MSQDEGAGLASTFMNVRPKWVPDEEVTNCNKCQGEFSLFNRKVRLFI